MNNGKTRPTKISTIEIERPEDSQQPPKRRILSIDGGGIRGVFPAAILTKLEEGLEKPIGSYFDLIAGTSTGGILAIGLALGLRASTILELYEKHGAKIFGESGGAFGNFLYSTVRNIRKLYRPKHDSDVLRSVLQSTFGTLRIGDATTRLLIPTWNPSNHSVRVYKTAHHPRLERDYLANTVDVALATSAAPTYFEMHNSEQDGELMDGGIWANNPVAIAVVEALSLLDWPRESIYVLSLGCIDGKYRIPKRAGIMTLGTNAFNLLFDGQSRSAMGMAQLLLGHQHERNAICRINATGGRGLFKLDDARHIPTLKKLGFEKGSKYRTDIYPTFFDKPAKPFIPIYNLKDRNFHVL